MVRRFLEEKSPETEVRRLMATTEGYDAGRVAPDGRPARPPGDDHPRGATAARGSATSSCWSSSRRWAPRCCARRTSPRSRSRRTRCSARATRTRRSSGSGSIASGETIATLALTEDSGRWDLDASHDERRRSRGGGWTLDGHKSFVLDGHTAGLILVAAQDRRGDSRSSPWSPTRAGLTRTPLATMDQTRKQARLEFAATPATLVGRDGDAASGLEQDAAAGRRRARRRAGRAAPSASSTTPWTTRRTASSSAGRSAASRRSSTSAPTCSWRSSRPSPPRTTGRGRPSTDDDELAARGEPRQVLLLGGLLPLRRRRTSRSTAGSASPGSTTRTCTSSARRAPSCCWATPRTTANCWRSGSGI